MFFASWFGSLVSVSNGCHWLPDVGMSVEPQFSAILLTPLSGFSSWLDLPVEITAFAWDPHTTSNWFIFTRCKLWETCPIPSFRSSTRFGLKVTSVSSFRMTSKRVEYLPFESMTSMPSLFRSNAHAMQGYADAWLSIGKSGAVTIICLSFWTSEEIKEKSCE